MTPAERVAARRGAEAKRRRKLADRLLIVAVFAGTFYVAQPTRAATAPPPPPPVAGIVSFNLEAQVIRLAFRGTGVARRAVSVARCESGLDERARNGEYRGLFQLSRLVRWRVRDLTGWRRVGSDAWENARAARYLWRGRGWAPWPVCGRR